MKQIIDKLYQSHSISREEILLLLNNRNDEISQYLFAKARDVRQSVYGNDVYIRGLIEISNYCKNDCYYCGIRKSNRLAERYRLSEDEILACCQIGYELGFRTFVMQGGEDGYFTDERMVNIIRSIKKRYSDCAVTLSLGEKSYDTYKAYFDAGADRYLLRHETATDLHYSKLHPEKMLLSSRIECLKQLKQIGFQTGCGFMVGSPFQTLENIADDLLFIKEFDPQMVGIGPFIPHKDTPFADHPAGSVELTIFLLGIIRLMLPSVLLPATTALATLSPNGRSNGILAGANVIMPNLSPEDVRGKYLLYNNKKCKDDEAAQAVSRLMNDMQSIGYKIVFKRGDYKG